MRRDPKAAFTKHSNIAAIDCYSHTASCLITSRVSFAEITSSKRDLDSLNSVLEEQLQARDEEESSHLFARVVEKRSGQANTLYSSTHLKTYHDVEDNPSAGFQHYIVWDLKVCRLSTELELREQVE